MIEAGRHIRHFRRPESLPRTTGKILRRDDKGPSVSAVLKRFFYQSASAAETVKAAAVFSLTSSIETPG